MLKKAKNIFIFITILSVFTIAYGFQQPKTQLSSDTTSILPLSLDLLTGNIMLKQWILGSNNFYFTETLIYAIGYLFHFSSSFLLRWIPSLAWPLIFMCSFIFLNIYKKKFKYIVAFSIPFLCILAIIPIQVTWTYLCANSHNNLYVYLMFFLLILKKYLNTNNKALLIIMAFIIGTMQFSESVTLMVLIIPVTLFSILGYIMNRDIKYLYTFGAVIVGYLLATLNNVLFSLNGGMETLGLPIKLAHPREYFPRFKSWMNHLLILLDSGNVPSWGHARVYDWICVIFLWILIVFLITYPFFYMKKTDEEKLFYLIALVNFGLCLFTNVDQHHRYIIPGFYFGFFLLFATISDYIQNKTWQYYALCILLFGIPSIYLGQSKLSRLLTANYFGEDQKQIASIIKEENLGDGYGDFWCASQLSYYLDYDINVYPIVINGSKDKIYPHDNLINKNWFCEDEIHYIVAQADPVNSNFIDEDVMVQICGEPDRKYSNNAFTIYWWEKDVSEYVYNGLFDDCISVNEMQPQAEKSEFLTICPQSENAFSTLIMSEGKHCLKIAGEGIDNADLSILSSDGEWVEYEVNEKSDAALVFSFELKKTKNDLELHISNNGENNILIKSIEAN